MNQNSQAPKSVHTPASARGLHQRTQKASTLMRGTLKRPASNLGNRIQSLRPGVNPQRELRARKITKHGRVEHFGIPSPKAQPETGSARIIRGEIVNRKSPPAGMRVQAQQPALPSMVASVSHQRLERMLDAALTQADAHKQALKYHAARHFWQKPGFMGRRRWLKLSAIIVLLVLVMLTLAWQKMPQLSARIAGMRAHVDASVPEYKPDGYQLATPVTIQSGAVVIKYKAPGGGNSGFDVAEQSSNLTSTSLAQTVVPQGSQVQTSHVDGNTVYIYGPNNDAAWVNNGVLYTIKDRSQLSSDQILKIVHSLN